MKTKILTTGILGILLVFSLILTACPTEADDDPPTTPSVTPPAETFTNVTANFPLADGLDDLTIVAWKSDKTGVIAITLSGSVSQEDNSGFNNTFGTGSPNKLVGNYASVSVSLASLLEPVSDQVIAIRQENDALRYYQGLTDGGGLLGSAPPTPVFEGALPNIYIPEQGQGTPVKWKAYDEGAWEDTEDGDFSFLVSDAASPKTVRFDITTWSANEEDATKTGNVATIIIDYSAVTIAETFTNVADDFSLADGLNGSLTIESALKSDKTGIIAITLNGSVSQGDNSNFDDTFGTAGPNKPDGNYASVSVSLASLLEQVSGVIAIRQENDALRYYQGLTDGGGLLGSAPPTPVFGGALPNIYIPAQGQGTPVKWKAYDEGAWEDTEDGDFSFLVSDVASPKTVRFDITTWSANEEGADKTGDVATIIIDYSAVTVEENEE
ncbi:MAG: hypothetical protein LBP20_03030 [Treponema sp.]|jgi:hypothetical protein|nr:hypothetical protein [Treponema sp.]